MARTRDSEESLSAPAAPPRTQALFRAFLGSRVATALLSLVSIILVTRFAAVDVAGVYLAAVGFATLLFLFIDLGTGPHLVRQAASGDRDYEISVYVWTRLLLSLLIFLMGGVVAGLLFDGTSRTAAFVAMLLIFTSITQALGPISQVTGETRTYQLAVLSQGFFSTIGLLVVFAFEGKHATAVELVSVYVVAGSFSGAWTVSHLWRFVTSMPTQKAFAAIAQNMRAVAILGVATALSSVYYRIDQALILRLNGSTAAAHYGLSYRVLDQATLVPTALQMATAGFIASFLSEGIPLPNSVRLSLSRAACALGVGLSLGIAATSDLTIWVLGGGAYAPAATYVNILAIGMAIIVPKYVIVMSTLMARRDSVYLVAVSLLTVVNITGNLVLLRHFGPEAAAVMTIGCELGLVLFLTMRLGLDSTPVYPRYFWAGLGCAAGGAALKYAVRNSQCANYVASPLICFFAVAFLVYGYRQTKRLTAEPLAGAAP